MPSCSSRLSLDLPLGKGHRPVLLFVSCTSVAGVRQVHSVCGRPVRRVSLGLDDLFGDEDMDAEPELPSAAHTGAAADGGDTQLQSPGIPLTANRRPALQYYVCMPTFGLRDPSAVVTDSWHQLLAKLLMGAWMVPLG